MLNKDSWKSFLFWYSWSNSPTSTGQIGGWNNCVQGNVTLIISTETKFLAMKVGYSVMTVQNLVVYWACVWGSVEQIPRLRINYKICQKTLKETELQLNYAGLVGKNVTILALHLKFIGETNLKMEVHVKCLLFWRWNGAAGIIRFNDLGVENFSWHRRWKSFRYLKGFRRNFLAFFLAGTKQEMYQFFYNLFLVSKFLIFLYYTFSLT